jgi:hypothetical protein
VGASRIRQWSGFGPVHVQLKTPDDAAVHEVMTMT